MAKLEQEGKSADSQLDPVSLNTSTFSEYSYSNNLFIQLPGLEKKIQKYNNMYTHLLHRRHPGKLSNSLKWSNPSLK